MTVDRDAHPTNHPHPYRKLSPWKIKYKLRVPKGRAREVATSFYQLKIDHGYNKPFLHHVNNSTNPRCRCVRHEMPQHLILECPETGNERKALQNMFKQLKFTKQATIHALMESKIGIQGRLTFLKNTRISTRARHMGRMGELAEERMEY
ncbi:hypothetical protein BJ878DRAFT_305443 [Calycina marina]|uniref:Reverse transcriptase n=1 Tax=Calycina marina TaxID=1763456 RepID=A0A9P8CB70_9HELO|nr:hypothetical protein BJ878DRAFT_305443 [Calycina marina]